VNQYQTKISTYNLTFTDFQDSFVLPQILFANNIKTVMPKKKENMHFSQVL